MRHTLRTIAQLQYMFRHKRLVDVDPNPYAALTREKLGEVLLSYQIAHPIFSDSYGWSGL